MQRQGDHRPSPNRLTTWIMPINQLWVVQQLRHLRFAVIGRIPGPTVSDLWRHLQSTNIIHLRLASPLPIGRTILLLSPNINGMNRLSVRLPAHRRHSACRFVLRNLTDTDSFLILTIRPPFLTYWLLMRLESKPSSMLALLKIRTRPMYNGNFTDTFHTLRSLKPFLETTGPQIRRSPWTKRRRLRYGVSRCKFKQSIIISVEWNIYTGIKVPWSTHSSHMSCTTESNQPTTSFSKTQLQKRRHLLLRSRVVIVMVCERPVRLHRPTNNLGFSWDEASLHVLR